jgi:two-component system KDP operon response regulator KdpE
MNESEAEWFEAENGEDGVRLVAHRNPDVVLLDLGLPDIDGLIVLQRLREWTDVPVIVLSARGQEKDKIAALDSGANDYLTKPFSIGELMARVRVALRYRQKPVEESVFECDGLRIDYASRLVSLDGNEVRLTVIEYRLLTMLTRFAGRVITQRQMLIEVWGPEYEDSTHTLRVHMGNLRAKIETNPAKPRFIRTETGVGYRFLVSG